MPESLFYTRPDTTSGIKQVTSRMRSFNYLRIAHAR